MKMIVIDGNYLEARVEDIEPSAIFSRLEELNPGQRCGSVMHRTIAGTEYQFCHDDEFLFHGGNFTGVCTDAPELILGSFIICAEKQDDEYDEDDSDLGLRDLGDEEIEAICAAWYPVSPEAAKKLAKDIHPSLLFMMGSNALHYSVQ